MKNIVIAVFLFILALGVLAGCVGTPDIKFEPVVLSQKAPEDPPIPLDQILAENSAAIDFASEKRDFLDGDKYLEYVIKTKERDAEAMAMKTVQAIQADNDQTQATLDAVPAAPSSDEPQQSSDPVPDPASSDPDAGDSDNGSDGDSDSGNQATTTRYYDEASGYSIEIPTGWGKIEVTFGELKMVQFFDAGTGDGDQVPESIGATSEELPLDMSSAEYLDQGVSGLKEIEKDFKEIERSDFEMDGRTGKKLVYTYTLDGKKVKNSLYAVTKDLRGYVVVGAGAFDQYDKYADDFDSAAKSFKFESGN